jgi:hypothetical protein
MAQRQLQEAQVHDFRERSLPCHSRVKLKKRVYWQGDSRRSQARASAQESSDTAQAEAQRQSQGAEERAHSAKATAEAGAKKINDDVEEMLQQMKRDLGMK